MEGSAGSRSRGLSVYRGAGLHGCIIFYISAQGLGAAADNSYALVYLGMDFCLEQGKWYVSVLEVRVEVIGRRMVNVTDHECRKRSEPRS